MIICFLLFQNPKLSLSLGQISQAGKHRPDCPKHALAQSDFLREVSTISTDQKLPFIKALCNDKDLINTCNCGVTPQPLSMSTSNTTTAGISPGGGGVNDSLYEPGTMVRPLSWCSGQLTGTMRVLGGSELADQQQQQDTTQEHEQAVLAAAMAMAAAAGNSHGDRNRQRSVTVAGAEGIGRFLPAAMQQARLQPPPPHP